MLPKPQMSVEELAKTIYEDRLAKLATGEGGLVDPQELGARERVVLEEWALTQAKKHKTLEAYQQVQDKARERLRKMVSERRQAEAQAGINQGLLIQAALAKADRVKKMLN